MQHLVQLIYENTDKGNNSVHTVKKKLNTFATMNDVFVFPSPDGLLDL
jgi:hypothetical protein